MSPNGRLVCEDGVDVQKRCRLNSESSPGECVRLRHIVFRGERVTGENSNGEGGGETDRNLSAGGGGEGEADRNIPADGGGTKTLTYGMCWMVMSTESTAAFSRNPAM